MTITEPRVDDHLDVRPLAGHIGAEIHGVDISQPLDAATIDAIRTTWLRWKVVFFRDQQLDHASHVRFARAFGDPTPAHPLFDSVGDPDHPTVYPVFKDRFKARYDTRGFDHVQWHADVTAALNPPAASILRADVVPPYGGDTQFANTVAAYDALSPSLQRLAGSLRAVHRFRLPDTATDDYRRRHAARPLVTEHPVVRVHPETGERALYVNPSFTTHLVDVSPHESRRLLDLFYDALAQPQHTVRFAWKPGSVAFWDNRAAVHLAPRDSDHLDGDRRLYRVTLVGDVPVGIDGRTSTPIEGTPFEAL
jgi:taurine dioxygenase